MMRIYESQIFENGKKYQFRGLNEHTKQLSTNLRDFGLPEMINIDQFFDFFEDVGLLIFEVFNSGKLKPNNFIFWHQEQY